MSELGGRIRKVAIVEIVWSPISAGPMRIRSERFSSSARLFRDTWLYYGGLASMRGTSSHWKSDLVVRDRPFHRGWTHPFGVVGVCDLACVCQRAVGDEWTQYPSGEGRLAE